MRPSTATPTSEIAQKTAIRWLGRDDRVVDITYADLRSLTNRFANVLESLGVSRGDRVFGLTGRIPELYVTALGALKQRAVFSPLFSAFGPEPIKTRLSIAEARVLVTTGLLYERKIAPIRDQLPSLEFVLIVDGEGVPDVPGAFDFHQLMSAASEDYEIQPTAPGELALLHFTSGTTGTPKGALHVHEAVVVHNITGKLALDLHPDDVFWCTADPGWVTGTSYGIIAPLTNGVTSIVDEEEFDLDRWYRILDEQKVSVWYTAPTAIRMMMRAGVDPVKMRTYPALRFMGSVGEPLNPEAVVWGQEAFGLPFHDNWWQTETGGIMIANFACADIMPGSMGRPLPGIDAAIVRRTNSHVEVLKRPNAEGELALKPGWPSMFRGYWNEEERYRKCFVDGWYITGDLARRDARRLLLVRRPGRRRHQDLWPPDWAFRSGNDNDGAPRGRRGRRNRQARPRGNGDREGVRAPQCRLRAQRGAEEGASSPSPASGWARSSHPRRSTS